ncbi:MAG: hypothetical protein RBG13Loki_3956 [Promethearchaeota archaeon CR_4]|nr:MAG: hypothetical protein RBG13Loki_3956 [Candidatus Lokiarchaeota archaeon CR_4]
MDGFFDSISYYIYNHQRDAELLVKWVELPPKFHILPRGNNSSLRVFARIRLGYTSQATPQYSVLMTH